MSGTELITVGAEAPDFTLDGHDGRTWRLADVLAEKHALLIFYPGNNTPG